MSDDLSVRPQQPLAELGPVLGELVHDLANEVQLLHGWALLARGEGAAGRSGLAEMDRVVDLSAHLGRMLRDVLETMAGEALSPEVIFDPAAVAERLLNDRVREMAALEVQLTSRLPRAARVRGRTTFWSRAVANLVGNAARHARRVVRVSLELEHQAGQEWVVARVEDDGGGIAADDRLHIFEPLWRGEHGHLGLGLSAVAWMAAQLGGTVRYADDCALGGAAFVLRVPTATPLGRPPHGSGKAAAPLAGMRLVLIDDDAGVRTALGRLLRRAGADVRELDPCGEPMEWVIARILRASPDLVMLDLCLGGRSGVALWKRLREELPQLARRVAFVSGAVPGDADWEAATATGQPVLPKPFDFEELTRAIQALDGRG